MTLSRDLMLDLWAAVKGLVHGGLLGLGLVQVLRWAGVL
jgi:hypothetical protein